VNLRPDQVEAADRIRAAYHQGARDVLGIFPTGWGKTHLASDVVARTAARGGTAGFFTDREEIALDTTARLRARGLRVGLVMADAEPDPAAPVQVLSIPTCRARGLVPALRLGIWDEVHHLGSDGWRELFDAVRARGAFSLGITATGQRGDGRPLDMFQAVVHGPGTRWCIEQGLLVPVHVVAPPTIEDEGLAASPLEAYQRWAPGTRALVFCANTAHVDDTVADFARAGIPVESLVGTTARGVRRGVRERFAAGGTRVLVGCGVFIEGFDAPAAETIVLARSFGVCGTFLQAIGRGLRRSPATGKTRCVVVDLRGSVHLHGLPDEDRVWSLDGTPARRTEKLPTLRRCAACGAIFRPSSRCPLCGEAATAAAKVPRNLNRAERLSLLSDIPQRELDRRYLEKLEFIAAGRMRLPLWKARAWALRQFEKTRGRKPEVAA
jgi:DNA repair protein RadD